MECNAPQELQGNERKGGKAFRSLLDSVGPKWLGCLSKSKQMLGVIGEFATEILCLSYFLFLKTLKLHQITMLENTSCQADYHVVLDKWANVLFQQHYEDVFSSFRLVENFPLWFGQWQICRKSSFHSWQPDEVEFQRDNPGHNP